MHSTGPRDGCDCDVWAEISLDALFFGLAAPLASRAHHKNGSSHSAHHAGECSAEKSPARPLTAGFFGSLRSAPPVQDPSLLAAESRTQSLTAQLPALALAGAMAIEGALAPKEHSEAEAADDNASAAAPTASAQSAHKHEEVKQPEHAQQDGNNSDASASQPTADPSADSALSDGLSDVHLEPAVAAAAPGTSSEATPPAAAAPMIVVSSPGGATIPVAQPVGSSAAASNKNNVAASSSAASVPPAAAHVAPASSDAAAAPSPVAPPATTTSTPPPSNATDPQPVAPASAPASAPAKAGWNWWWSKKSTIPTPTPAPEPSPTSAATATPAPAAVAAAAVDPKAAAVPVAAVSAGATAASKSVTLAPPPSTLSSADQSASATVVPEKDHLGGVESPWLHSVVRYSINKLLGFEEMEEGMEERYHTVLCREALWVPADISLHDQAGHKDGSTLLSADADSEKDPPLMLEMSHFYPKGCHNTPLPVILVRTPYDRALMRHTAERICQHGYHCVIQDTRNSPNAALLKAKQHLQRKVHKAAAAADAASTAAANATAAAATSAAHAAPLQELDELQKAYNSNPSSPQAPEDSTAAAASAATSAATSSSSGDTLTVPAASSAAATSNSPASSPSSAAASSAAGSPSPAASPSPRSAASSSPSNTTGQVGPGAIPSLSAAPQEFFPIVHESKDGLATIDWISKQPWCDGNISFYGASYLGIAQYAVVDHKHPALKCIVPVVSASRVYPILYPEGSLNLDLAARWLYIMFHPSVTGPVAEMVGGAAGAAMAAGGGAATAADPSVDAKLPSFWRRSYARVVGQRNVIPAALQHLPACDLDRLVTEKRLSFFQEMIANGHDETLPFWTEKQVKLCDLHNAPPLLIIEGWYDLFLQQALRDYTEALEIHKTFQARVSSGEISPEQLAAMKPSVQTFKPYLTIMNCVHIDWKQLYRISLTESMKWLTHTQSTVAALVRALVLFFLR